MAGLEADLPLFADQLTLSYLAHAEPSVSLGTLETRGCSCRGRLSNKLLLIE
jgi:hypothetical protein